MDADIDRHGSGLDPVGVDDARLADGHEQVLGLAHQALEIAREPMGDGDRRAGQQQLQRQRTADDVRGADDHGLGALGIQAVGVEQRHHAPRRAGPQAGVAKRELAYVERMETVDVLGRIDPARDGVLVHVRRKRQLDQDAVDLVVGIELVDQREQAFLVRPVRQPEVARLDASARGGLDLVADVDVGGGIIADQHHGQAGWTLAALAAVLDGTPDIGDHAIGDRPTVQDRG